MKSIKGKRITKDNVKKKQKTPEDISPAFFSFYLFFIRRSFYTEAPAKAKYKCKVEAKSQRYKSLGKVDKEKWTKHQDFKGYIDFVKEVKGYMIEIDRNVMLNVYDEIEFVL